MLFWTASVGVYFIYTLYLKHLMSTLDSMWKITQRPHPLSPLLVQTSVPDQIVTLPVPPPPSLALALAPQVLPPERLQNLQSDLNNTQYTRPILALLGSFLARFFYYGSTRRPMRHGVMLTDVSWQMRGGRSTWEGCVRIESCPVRKDVKLRDWVHPLVVARRVLGKGARISNRKPHPVLKRRHLRYTNSTHSPDPRIYTVHSVLLHLQGDQVQHLS